MAGSPRDDGGGPSRIAPDGRRPGGPAGAVRTLLGADRRPLVRRRPQARADELRRWRLQQVHDGAEVVGESPAAQDRQEGRRQDRVHEGVHQVHPARQQDQGRRPQRRPLPHLQYHSRYSDFKSNDFVHR